MQKQIFFKIEYNWVKKYSSEKYSSGFELLALALIKKNYKNLIMVQSDLSVNWDKTNKL